MLFRIPLFLIIFSSFIVFQSNSVIAQNESTPPAEPTSELVIVVNNALEFLNAIGSNRKIIIQSDAVLQLDEVDIKTVKNNHVVLMNTFDGFEFSFMKVENLTIEGTLNEKSERPKIYNRYSYSNVLSFYESKNVNLKNLTVGHFPEPGYCTGNVLKIYESEKIILENMDLFGSGAYGLELYEAKSVTVNDSIIRECTFGFLTANATNEIVFNKTLFKDTKGYSLFELGSSFGKLTINDSKFIQNSINDDYNSFFSFYDATVNEAAEASFGTPVTVEINRTQFEKNEIKSFVEEKYKDRVVLKDTIYP